MKNYDVSLSGVIINCTQSDSKKLLFEVAVLKVIKNNLVSSKWNFKIPPIVKFEVYYGNLTSEQIVYMTQKGTFAVFGITLGDEILVEEGAYVTSHHVQELGEFLTGLNVR